MNLMVLVIYSCMLIVFFVARWIKHDGKLNQFKLPKNDIFINYANVVGHCDIYS